MNTLNAYEKVNRTTANPKQALLLMYDHAISNLAQCEKIVINNKGWGAYPHLVKAKEIITVLANGLSYEDKLKEISTHFFSVYQHMMVKLSEITDLESGDTSILAEVRQRLEDLRECWAKAKPNPSEQN